MLSLLRMQKTMPPIRNITFAFRIISSLLLHKKPFSSNVNNFKHIPSFKNRSLPDYKTGFGSQFYPSSPSEVAGDKIKRYFSEKSPETFDEWEDAKMYFFTEISLMSDINYSSIVMNTLLNENNIKLAQSFMNYLQKSNMKPNVLAYLQYIALCGKNVDVCGQEEILKSFNKIQDFINNTPIFDMKRATYLIQGICSTDKWRSAFDYLKRIPSPCLEIRNNLASAAIRNGDEALAWEIILKRFRKGEVLGNQAIEEFLKYANRLLVKDKHKAETFLLKFFQYMECNNILLTEITVTLVESFFRSHSPDWNIKYAKVERTGKCNICKKHLKPMELSASEFSVLEKSFMEKSVKKGDIFINTTLEEFNRYISFIERHKPFHVVIDALNVAYTTKKKKNSKSLAIHLLQIVERVSSKASPRILVLGRKYMAGWPQNIMRKISNRSAVFLTNNISQDDPFTVHAALASGPNTFILTLDLMRDHMSRLEDPYLIALFKKWQQSHQILLAVDEDNNFKLMIPVKHSISIQGNMESGWHIPYDDEIIREPYEELNNWLCIQKS